MDINNKSRYNMSRNYDRKDYYRNDRDRDREWSRSDYNRKRSRSPPHTRADDKRRSRSPRKVDKDVIDENILSEISKLPEPSELWDSQMQDASFPPPAAPAFSQEGSNYNTNYQSYAGIYNEFPSVVPSTTHPPDTASWNQMSLPPPLAPPMYNVEDQIKKEAAMETEMRHQKAALSKQREDYIKKTGILKKELDTLKDQRSELRGDSKRSPSPDTKRFLKENTKLQLEIQNKLKTINNVVDMLNGIIGEEAQEIVIDSDESTERNSKRKSRSPSANSKKFNYVYYDPEMHWCRVCNDFPPTAKDYLNHLHSPSHHKMAAAHMEAPWHTVSGMNEGFPSFTSAPTKRTPIRGLQFFVPSTAWYCKLCDQFIGDLHCASAHLKSIVHSKNYTNFVEQNPHWETDWMSDRQKAFEKARASNKIAKVEEKPQQYTAHTITFSKDGFHTKRKVESPPPAAYDKKKRDKKKKSKRKKSSSSSSSSSSSDSDSEPKRKKKNKKTKSKSDDKLSEWMSSIQMDRLNDNDRKLLDNIKTRIKLDKIESSRRSPDRERDRGRSVTTPHNTRVPDRRDSRSREDRDRERDRERREESRRRDVRRDERRDEGRESERRSPTQQDAKKVKMPFIGKMPVYKNLAKTTKPEEPKKDDTSKKEVDEAGKKRQQEIDAEIQKKVAEFKEKIAKAQLERQQVELPPPILMPSMPPMSALPPHAFMPPPPQQPPPPATSAPPPTLPKDFQDALDIIFPSADKQNPDMSQQQDQLFSGIPGIAPPGFPSIPGLGGMMPPFPQMSLLGNPPPHLMMGFDMNAPLFNPRHQLYDSHVPIMPNQNKRHNQMKNRQNQNKNNNYDKKNNTQNKNTTPAKGTNETSTPAAGTSAATAGTSSATAGTSAATPGPSATSTAASPVSKVTSTSVISAQTTTTTTAATPAPLPKSTPTPKNKEELDELAMLGIDASDVGAGI